jgi:hypothetical protein
MEAMRSEAEESSTAELVTGVVGDRCPSCQATLASDQRYCLSCGQRRGKPRFSLETLTKQAAQRVRSAERSAPPRSRFSPATSMVAGVATLLLAMGVGVLIGHNADSGTQRAAAPVQVLTVGGGAGVASNGAAGSAAATGPTKGKKIKPTVIKLSPKVKAAANQAAGKVLGTSNNLVKDATVQPGQACTGGAGCENGRFTGNFFGGG